MANGTKPSKPSAKHSELTPEQIQEWFLRNKNSEQLAKLAQSLIKIDVFKEEATKNYGAEARKKKLAKDAADLIDARIKLVQSIDAWEEEVRSRFPDVTTRMRGSVGLGTIEHERVAVVKTGEPQNAQIVYTVIDKSPNNPSHGEIGKATKLESADVTSALNWLKNRKLIASQGAGRGVTYHTAAPFPAADWQTAQAEEENDEDENDAQ